MILYQLIIFFFFFLLRILSEGQYDSNLYLVFPYYENGTLQSYLLTSNRTLSINQCLRYFHSLASAISYLHLGQNSSHMMIVHRDIKSANILICKNELNLYLADFGVAIALPQILTEKDFVQIGTMRYMAPELLEGVIAHTREALCSVDMYALALVMWEILTQCDVYPMTGKF
jgi:serine/threonine protein kinase